MTAGIARKDGRPRFGSAADVLDGLGYADIQSF